MTGRGDAIVVAIDGPAGSGKSSTAKAVALALGYRHLDSGAFYRAITLAALDDAIPTERWRDLTEEDLDGLMVDAHPTDRGYGVRVKGRDVEDRIRSPDVNAHVSTMAAVPAVRDWLLGALRAAGRDRGLVADGRDIGTVVFPDAELKVFLVCEPEERARRRLLQQGRSTPTDAEIRAEAQRLVQRDERDRSRGTAPLRRAADAVLLDTTELRFDEQVAAIAELARQAIRG